jgi:hypothetical protein
MDPTTVLVDLGVRGAWEVALPDRRERVPCESLEEACRVAYRCARDRRPCQLIIRDAYHRVLQRQLMMRRERPARPRRRGQAGEN